MPAPALLRPAEAARRFGVARTTLADWADRGWIGRTRVGRVTLYPSSDIADLLATHTTPRRLVPLSGRAQPAAVAPDWRDDELWEGAR